MTILLEARSANGRPNGFKIELNLPDQVPQPYKLSPFTREELLNKAVDRLDCGGKFVAFFTGYDDDNADTLAAVAEALEGDVVTTNGISMFFWRRKHTAKRQRFLDITEKFMAIDAMRYQADFRLKVPLGDAMDFLT